MTRRSKLGFHFGNEHKESDFHAVMGARPRSAILLSDHADWRWLRPMIESTRYPIVRLTSWRPAGFPDGEAATLAQEWLDHARGRAVNDTASSGVDLETACRYANQRHKKLLLIGPNEIGLSYRYGQFEAWRAYKLAEMGALAVIANHAVGTSTPQEVEGFKRGFESVVRSAYDGIWPPFVVGIHEYWRFPWDWMGEHQGPQTDYWERHPPLVGIGREAWLLNRWWHDDWWDNARFILTETGADLIGGLEGAASGWRDTQGYWKAHHARGKDKTFYASLLQWQDKQLQLDARVLAHNVFLVGPNYGLWQSFDIGDHANLYALLDYIVREGEVSDSWLELNYKWFMWRLQHLRSHS